MSEAVNHLVELGRIASSKINQDANLRAQALLNQISSAEQTSTVDEAFEIMETFIQLDGKLGIVDWLLPQAMSWADSEKRTLLGKIMKLIQRSKLRDVEAFVAFSIPIVRPLGGDESFWSLYERIKWAYSAE